MLRTAILLLPLAAVAIAVETLPAPAPAPVVDTDDADDAAPAPAAAAAGIEPAFWRSTGKLGAFGSSVVTREATTSRDPAIAGTGNDTIAYRLSLETGLDYRNAKHSLDQRLLAKYGRQRDDVGGWLEDADEVRYDGVYRYSIRAPHFVYTDWGWESTFTGPEPEERAFDPGLVKASAGYGQLYEDLLPESDKLEGRLGAGVRKRYGHLGDLENDPQYGLTAFLRYEREQTVALRYFAQYEGFAEFNDLGHVTNVVTAGLTAKLSTLLTAELGLRAYYESAPEDAADGDVGYDEWSLRQDTLLGLTYIW